MKQRVGVFAGWICAHTFYDRVFQALSDEIESCLSGGSLFIFTLLGPSGAGKSEVLKDVLARFEGRLGESGQSQVRSLPMPTEVTRKSLPKAIIREILGEIAVKGDTDELKQIAEDALLDTSVLMLDEVNHWVEARSSQSAQTKENRQLADWLKILYELKHKSLVLAVLTANVQLGRRALRPYRLDPYDWSLPDQRQHFADAVLGFVTRMKDAGWRIQADQVTVTRGAYFCGGGLIGSVHALLERADLIGHKDRCLDNKLLAQAYSTRFAESGSGNPFEMTFIPDALLNDTHQRTLFAARAPVFQMRAGGHGVRGKSK